jgi:hypothetical protein
VGRSPQTGFTVFDFAIHPHGAHPERHCHGNRLAGGLSSGGGVQVMATRHVELDFGDMVGSTAFPLHGSAFYWRALVRF